MQLSEIAVDYSPDQPYSLPDESQDIDAFLANEYASIEYPETLEVYQSPSFNVTKDDFQMQSVMTFNETDKSNAMMFGVIILLLYIVPKMFR